MYALSVANGESPFCLSFTAWWATMAVSGSEKVLCALVRCSVGSVCVCVCVCLFVCMRVCCHQMNFFVFQCNSYLSHCTCFTLGVRSLFFQWSRHGWDTMCGVPSFDLAFTYYSLLKCKAFSITERAIFAFCQRNCPSTLVHAQLRRLFFFSRSDVDEMICVECRLLLSLLYTKRW